MTIAFVQKGANSVVNGGSTNTPTITGVVAGNWLIALGWGASGNTAAIPTPSGWLLADSGVGFADTGVASNTAIFYKQSAGGSESCLFSYPDPATFGEAAIIEVSSTVGLVLDTHNSNGNTTGSGGTVTTPVATSAPNALVVATATALNAAFTTASFSTASTSFSIIYNDPTAATTAAGDSAYKIVSTTGVQSATWTWSPSSAWNARIATFVEPVATIGARLNIKGPKFRAGIRGTQGSTSISGPNSYTMVAGGTVTFSGAAALIKGQVYNPTGSVTFSGTAIEARGRFITPSGSVTFSGAAAEIKTRVQVPSGGITFTGASPEIRGKIYAPSGSVVFSGTAPITFSGGPTSHVIVVSGGFTLSGIAAQIHGRVQVPTGSVTFSGTAIEARGRVISPTGTVTFSGAAPQIRSNVIAPTGSVVFSGTAPMTFNGNIPASGVTTRLPLTFAGNS